MQSHHGNLVRYCNVLGSLASYTQLVQECLKANCMDAVSLDSGLIPQASPTFQ